VMPRGGEMAGLLQAAADRADLAAAKLLSSLMSIGGWMPRSHGVAIHPTVQAGCCCCCAGGATKVLGASGRV